ncbi:MAG: hypothetical protein ABSA26_01260 [Thermoguttaceae bacterium]
MIRSLLCAMIIFITMLAVFSGYPAAVQAADRHSEPGDLFYNFYVPPVGDQSVGAELYLCPRPVPPLVGWTYITYQPLMPHEFLYHHHRTYAYYHADGGKTLTSVSWR